ncbi:MAG: hypothetical protein JW881_15600 [Spirochaetales bacterium]|nr:hypothetical protein [Spirochaetales bacterium]
MSFIKSKIVIALLLISASVVLYFFHYLMFHDSHHIFIYLLGDIAFLPLEVLLVSLVIENLLSRKEKREKLEKLNMVIETFFSEFGKDVLKQFSACDRNLNQVRKYLVIEDCTKKTDFKAIKTLMKTYNANIDIATVDLPELSHFLSEKRHFLLNLLQNPNLLEHQSFTETIMAIFHITEELAARDLSRLSEDDRSHTKQDIERAYRHLIFQWLGYMSFIQKHYPYFFLFAAKTNPFNRERQ